MVAQLRLQLFRILTRIAGDDAVNQRRTKCIGGLNSVAKSRGQLPLFGVA